MRQAAADVRGFSPRDRRSGGDSSKPARRGVRHRAVLDFSVRYRATIEIASPSSRALRMSLARDTSTSAPASPDGD